MLDVAALAFATFDLVTSAFRASAPVLAPKASTFKTSDFQLVPVSADVAVLSVWADLAAKDAPIIKTMAMPQTKRRLRTKRAIRVIILLPSIITLGVATQ
jgi:hypothetical protein